jgi:TPP-dependent pyruvate/acetoin dehydrogenase alpha subunit
LNDLKKEDYQAMYRWLYLIRRTEETMVEYHQHTPIIELPHVSIGQEAISVGCCYNLRREDLVAPSLRTRGAFLVKGISSRDMMAGAFARDIHQTRGKNTSHHMGDMQAGVLCGTGIVAGHLAVANGAALAFKMKKQDRVVVSFFGDGATNRADFHEALNLAAIWDLPHVYVIENNLYAISTPAAQHVRIQDLAARASSYGIPGVVVDGNDLLAVYETCQKACDRARAGEGPTLIECKTYRWRGHSERDPRDDRPKDEIEAWKEKCPVRRFKDLLISKKIATAAELKSLEDSAEAEVADAVRFAENCPNPPLDILEAHVYATEVGWAE